MNLLFDSLNKPNLESYNAPNAYSYFYHKGFYVPQIFYQYKDIIKCYTTNQINELDFFVYPINFCDPYYHPELNKSGKFLTHIDKQVLDKVKNNKGIILIDAIYEAFNLNHSLELKENIEKLTGINNVFLNSRFFHLFPDDTFFTNFPSLLEFSECHVQIDNEIKVNTNKKFCLFGSSIDKHIGGLCLIKWLKEQKLLSQGHISLSRTTSVLDNGRWLAFIRPFIAIDALNYVDFNIVVESWFTSVGNEDYPFLSEKVFRNIHYKKPFVLVGQVDTIKQFKRLGYKTYDEVFDESYDTEKDSYIRLHKVFTQIQRLINEPEDFWQKNKEKLDDIHNHNLNNYNNRILSLSKFYEDLTRGVI